MHKRKFHLIMDVNETWPDSETLQNFLETETFNVGSETETFFRDLT